MEKKREELAVEDTWNLNAMMDESSLDSEIEHCRKLLHNIEKYQGHILDSADSLYAFYQDFEILDRLIEKIYIYTNMKCDQDTTNTINQANKMKAEKLNEEYSEKTSFVGPELLSVDFEVIEDFIRNKIELQPYRFDLEKMFRYKSHTLSEREEEIIAKASNAMGTGHEAFYNLDNSDIHLGKIKDEENNEVELTNSNYSKYMNSKNRRVRKDAFEAMYHYWEGIKNTIAATLKGNIKENFFESNIHKYKNPLEESMYADNIDVKVYKTLIETVHENLDKMYEYMSIRKQILGLEEMHMYDIYVDLVDAKANEIPYEEGKQMVLQALKPLGDTYIEDLKKAFDERWIDVYPNVGKKSGAYSWGCYDSYPYLLLNYNGTIDSVSTMAHELGHSMHSYYSNHAQDYLYHNYPIFLAEIASTVNEVLMNEYLYQNAKTKEEKILYITEFLDKIRTTIYRQTMFAEFEMLMHDKEEQGIPLTEEEFSNTYYELNKKYYGDNIISDDLIRYEWERIPHFYTSFYVYKYATGLSAAIAIASSILSGDKNAKEAYLEFLKSGGSDYPLEILKRAGVDITTKEPIEKALDMFKNKLEELKFLIN